MHAVDGGEEVVGRRVLEQIARGAGPERGGDLLPLTKAGQHQDTRGRVLRLDTGNRRRAVQFGHDHVHQDHVGPECERQFDRLGAGGSLVHDLPV